MTTNVVILSLQNFIKVTSSFKQDSITRFLTEGLCLKIWQWTVGASSQIKSAVNTISDTV